MSRTIFRLGRLAAFVSTSLALGLGVAASGQVIQQTPLRENPYRSPGGSCVYGGKGELLYAPKSSSCPGRQDQMQGRTDGIPVTLLEQLPADTRERLRQFFRTHSHIGDEIVRARKAVESGDRAAALRALDHVLAEVSANKAGAEEILGEISRQ